MVSLSATQALALWRDVSLSEVLDDGPDLTMRQMAILLCVYLEPPPHTVRGLARRLDVGKPVITRALDALGKRDLLARRRDEHDRRNVLIRRTVAGSLHVERLGDRIIRAGEALPW